MTTRVEEAIWRELPTGDPLPSGLGRLNGEERSDPLAIVQLLLLFHLFAARGQAVPDVAVAGLPS
jgi:hypothetical protein